MSTKPPKFNVYEDEPQCGLLDDKYFNAINMYDIGKERAKCQLCAQKCSVISWSPEPEHSRAMFSLELEPEF